MTIFILSILGIALLLVLRAMMRAPSDKPKQAIEMPRSISATTTTSNSLGVDPWDARTGDVVSITAGAEDFSDLDFPVDRRSAYEANTRRWVDLSGEYRGRRVYLEVYKFPQPDLLGMLDGQKLSLNEAGLNEDKLADLDSRQDTTATILFDRKSWTYESSREILYFDRESGEGEGLYRWMFNESNGDRVLVVEKWAGAPFEMRMGRRLKPRDVTVYRAA